MPFIKTGYWSPKPKDIWKVGKKLTEPYRGQLFFAGEHTQMDFFGYMEGALRSGERAAETLMLQECGLLEKPASKPSVPVRVALAAPTGESAAFEREVATPFKMRAAGDASEGKSPFLGRDLFTGEAAAEWEPRVAALVAESRFVNALEELGSGYDPGQLEEEEAAGERDGEEELEASEAWEELEQEELIPPQIRRKMSFLMRARLTPRAPRFAKMRGDSILREVSSRAKVTLRDSLTMASMN